MWIKLIRNNNWGYEFLASCKTQTVEEAVLIKEREGSKIRIRYPDQTTDTVILEHKHRSQTLQDMGHKYDVTFWHAMFSVDHHGLKLLAPFECVEVWSEDL